MNRQQLFEELFKTLDNNDIGKLFSKYIKLYDLSPKEAGETLRGLYLIAYYKVRQEFENYLREHPDIALTFDRIISKKPDKFEALKAIDLISYSAFKTTFLDKVEKELKNILEELTNQGELAQKLGQYVYKLAETDKEKAQQIVELLVDKRYAKVLAMIK